MRSQDLGDRFAAATLFVATVVYLASLPRYLGWADESYFLYEAKRIRDGKVMYRDIFQYVTPIAPYVMAGLYWLFGTTMATARVTTAVIHGLTAVLTFASARALSVSRSLALVAALAHVAIAQPAWPFASWHWFSTGAAAAILFALLRARWAASTPSVLGLGVLCGIFVCVQQQRGVVPTATVGGLLLADHLLDRWYGTPLRWRPIGLRLGSFALGFALIVIPTLLTFTYLAGMTAVYDALVRFPTENYRASFQTTWGALESLSTPYAADTFPRLLRFLPVAMIIPGLSLLVLVVRRRERQRVRLLTSLVIFGASSALSIWYYPDFIHIAFIAVPFFICASETVQCLIGIAPLPRALCRGFVVAVAVAAAAGLCQHLHGNMTAQWARYPHSQETAFGRIDFAERWEPLFVAGLRARLEAAPAREIFCYPNLAAPYLTAGGENPTPFQHFSARVFPPAATKRVLATLEAKRVAYIVASPMMLMERGALTTYITTHYESAPIQEIVDAGELPAFWLYRRKADDDAP